MRYVVRFTNGYWRVLDLQKYIEVGKFDLLRVANTACEEANLEEFADSAQRVIGRVTR